MGIIGYILGYFVTLGIGYIIVAFLLNKKQAVHTCLEIGIYSFLVGTVVIPFLLFVMGRIGIEWSSANIYMLIGILCLIGIGAYIYKKPLIHTIAFPVFEEFKKISLGRKLAIALGCVRIVVRVSMGAINLRHVPTYQDDTFANRNMRAKVFFYRQELVTDTNDEDYLGRGYKQYPLTLSLYKSFLATMQGERDEGAVNFPALIFYAIALLSILVAVRRYTNDIRRGFAGMYALASIPLYYIHGTNPYADIFQGVYFFTALYAGYLFTQGKSDWIRVGVMIGLLGYTKSEGLIIFSTAVYGALFMIYALSKIYRHASYVTLQSFVRIFALGMLINLPFILFKIIFGLGFGNGDAEITESISGLERHSEIFPALYDAFLYGGNYGLFFFFFATVLAIYIGKSARKKDDASLLYFGLLLAFCAIIFVYLTTYTYVYVLDQTGINRSIMQIMSVLVLCFILMLYRIYETKR